MNALRLIFAYIRHYIVAKNRHGLQSTFAYNLNEAVWRKDCKNPIQYNIEQYRKTLKHDNTTIEVRDFGAGFSGKVYKELAVSYIAKRSSKPPKYARMLFRLVNHLKPKYILEIGTSVGISALYQAMGNPDCKLVTLEGCENTATLAAKGFKEFPELDIEVLVGEFSSTIPEALSKLPRLDYVYLDGNHKLEPTLKYFNMCLEKAHNETVFIVDDINWSDEMKTAWNTIRNHSRVTISIDVFMMGIVFINKGFSKEHFKIRY